MSGFSMGKRVQGLFVVLVAAGVFAAICSVLPAQAAGTDNADERELTKLDDDWSEAAATKDADKVASFYAENARVYPPNEPLAVGRAGARKVWASMFADPNFISISWKTDHAVVAKSGDLGYTAGTYDYAFKGPDGKPARDKGKYVCTWKRQPDRTWKAVDDIWNSDAK